MTDVSDSRQIMALPLLSFLDRSSVVDVKPKTPENRTSRLSLFDELHEGNPSLIRMENESRCSRDECGQCQSVECIPDGDLKIHVLARGTIEGAATWSIRRPRDINSFVSLFGPTAFLKLREFRVLR